MMATDRDLAARLGELLRYPQDEAAGAARAAAEAALAGGHPAVATAVAHFAGEVAELSLGRLQELYTNTFDLAPRCVPYLSVHLFGQESFKRAALMAGLAETYARAGRERGGELPDHLAVVLACASAFDDAEWADLVELALARPLAAMAGALEAAGNPYRHLLAAVRCLLGVETVAAETTAEPLWRRRAARPAAAAATTEGVG
jgi:nitrate reductase molybdenum cofactor assembly chaperone